MATIAVVAIALVTFYSCGVEQRVSYRILGNVDADGVLYVVTPTELTANGQRDGYTWFEKPENVATIRIKSLDREATRIGYFSSSTIPVELPVTSGIVELQLLPIESAEGVVRSDHSLTLDTTNELGLRLMMVDFRATDPLSSWIIEARAGTTLFTTEPAGSYGFVRQASQVPVIRGPAYYVVRNSRGKYLIQFISFSAASVDIRAYLQPNQDASLLFLDLRTYERHALGLSEAKSRR